MGKVWWKALWMLTVLLAATGCWDRVEIEQRGFVVGAGIELPDETDQEEEDSETPDRPKGKQRYALTYQFVMPGTLGGQGEEGNQSQSFFNFTSTGESLLKITREFATRTGRSPYLEHLKVILVSEELAKRRGDFANAVDFFIRFHESRRNTKIFIVEGSPLKAFEINPRTEKLNVNYIESISKNHLKTARMLEPYAIDQLEEKLLLETSYTIPRIVVRKGDVKDAGAAVFHARGNWMLGWLDEEETQGLNYLRNEVKEDVITGQVRDNLIVYDVTRVDRKIKVDSRDLDHIKFTIELDVEGEIGESLETMNYMQKAAVNQAEESIKNEIIRLCNATLHKLQKEFEVDVVGLGNHLKRYYPKVWAKVRKDWDTGENHFAKSIVEVRVNPIIRNPGVVTESESRY
ncbi:hypothetical protein BEP19_15210 [Ammoniphilus oxalaticus]|uniref:Uncharacterized protein n=1 Tax=Ammoniphilus oxalaticus TaxID=66863 RepID=A0A419SDK1_9BACL|nr:Ger(x)C family spore germination protein [Ammoniphilus oxalaticus]RKD21027.1 hypothetical protein BEP19_15210 [Ammoniphilus oxalaticus]